MHTDTQCVMKNVHMCNIYDTCLENIRIFLMIDTFICIQGFIFFIPKYLPACSRGQNG